MDEMGILQYVDSALDRFGEGIRNQMLLHLNQEKTGIDLHDIQALVQKSSTANSIEVELTISQSSSLEFPHLLTKQSSGLSLLFYCRHNIPFSLHLSVIYCISLDLLFFNSILKN